MSFLNTILLAGAAAFVAPLLIHLFFRTKFRTVDWGAMQFLKVNAQSNTRRMQWQTWLLLLIRCAIPIILAVCLARPVLEAWKSAGESIAVALIIDNSFSMQPDLSASESVLGNAKMAATTIAQSLPRQSQLCVISSGGRALLQLEGATSDKRRIGEVIQKTKSATGAGRPIEAIQAARRQLDQLQCATNRIVMISDFQSSEWSDIPAHEFTELRELCEKASPKIQLCLLPVSNKTENLWAVDSIDISDLLVTPGWPISVRATIVNLASSDLDRLAVSLIVNGKALSQQIVDLPAQESKSIAFSVQLDQVGSHAITVACNATDNSVRDPIQADNQRSHSVVAAQPVKVLIVSQQPGNRSLQSPTGYLRIALSSNNATANAGLISVATTDPGGLSAREIDSAIAIVLTNIHRLDNRQLQLLSDFLDRGGLLMIVPGEQLDRAWHNEQLGANGKAWLPMALSDIVDDSGKPESAQSIRFQSFQHPALTWLNESDGSLISSVQWKRYFKLIDFEHRDSDPNHHTNSTGTSRTVLSLSSGEPLLVEKSVGHGKVLLWASALEDRWSNIVVRPVFVPLVQQLILQHAISQLPSLNLSTSDMLQLRTWQQSLTPQSSSEFVRLTMPNQLSASVEVDNSGEDCRLDWNDFTQPGIYRFEALPASLIPNWLSATESTAASSANRELDLQISVNSPTSESRMGVLSSEQLQRLSKQLGGTVVDSPADFLAIERIQREGYELFRWLLWGLLFFLFAELWIQRSVSKKLG